MRRSLCVLAALALLLACSSAAATDQQLQFEVSAGEQVYLNQLHAPENAEHLEQINAVFLELDSDADGSIDAAEMQHHLAEGTLSQAEHTLLQAFDNDASGSVSQSEFLMSPHTLAMLETEAEVDTQRAFRMGAINIIEEPMAAAEAAFEGRDAAPQRRLKSRAATAPVTMLSELSSHATIPADAKAAKRTSKGPSKRVAGKPLPVSIFGVPSVADEECVMCQYFVQRIQAGVADRLENGPGAAGAAYPQAGAQGLPGSTAAAQQTLKIRTINSQLAKKPGGRGVVRVVAEDVINGLCAVDKMPILFNPYVSCDRSDRADLRSSTAVHCAHSLLLCLFVLCSALVSSSPTRSTPFAKEFSSTFRLWRCARKQRCAGMIPISTRTAQCMPRRHPCSSTDNEESAACWEEEWIARTRERTSSSTRSARRMERSSRPRSKAEKASNKLIRVRLSWRSNAQREQPTTHNRKRPPRKFGSQSFLSRSHRNTIACPFKSLFSRGLDSFARKRKILAACVHAGVAFVESAGSSPSMRVEGFPRVVRCWFLFAQC